MRSAWSDAEVASFIERIKADKLAWDRYLSDEQNGEGLGPDVRQWMLMLSTTLILIVR
jgi:hypothetical protein